MINSEAAVQVSSKYRSIRLEVFCKKMFLEISQNSQENTCARVFFSIVAGLRLVTLLKKEATAQVFSYEFYEISENTFC